MYVKDFTESTSVEEWNFFHQIKIEALFPSSHSRKNKRKNSLKPRASLCAIIYVVSPDEDDKLTTRTAEQARG